VVEGRETRQGDHFRARLYVVQEALEGQSVYTSKIHVCREIKLKATNTKGYFKKKPSIAGDTSLTQSLMVWAWEMPTVHVMMDTIMFEQFAGAMLDHDLIEGTP